MTMQANGEAKCDRCGVDIGNAGVDKCVVVSALTDDGARVETLHLCLNGVPGGEGCVTRVLTKSALSWYVENVREAGAVPAWFIHTPPREESELDDVNSAES